VGGQVLESFILYPLNFILFIPPLQGLQKSFAPYKGLCPLLFITPPRGLNPPAGGQVPSKAGQVPSGYRQVPPEGGHVLYFLFFNLYPFYLESASRWTSSGILNFES
jgi:hypothetical protein